MASEPSLTAFVDAFPQVRQYCLQQLLVLLKRLPSFLILHDVPDTRCSMRNEALLHSVPALEGQIEEVAPKAGK